MTHVVDVLPQCVILDQVFKVQCGVIGRVKQYPTCDHLVFRVFGLSNISISFGTTVPSAEGLP
jgi:hypothetical protein